MVPLEELGDLKDFQQELIHLMQEAAAAPEVQVLVLMVV